MNLRVGNPLGFRREHVLFTQPLGICLLIGVYDSQLAGILMAGMAIPTCDHRRSCENLKPCHWVLYIPGGCWGILSSTVAPENWRLHLKMDTTGKYNKIDWLSIAIVIVYLSVFQVDQWLFLSSHMDGLPRLYPNQHGEAEFMFPLDWQHLGWVVGYDNTWMMPTVCWYWKWLLCTV